MIRPNLTFVSPGDKITEKRMCSFGTSLFIGVPERSGKMEGAIFDMDGTLLDSMHFWNEVGTDYLKEQGITPPVGLFERLKCMSLRQAAEYFRSEFGVRESAEEVMCKMNRIVEKRYFEESSAKPYVEEYLEQLQKQGVRMCVATATDAYLAEAALYRTGLNRFFSFVITCGQVGRGKDDPLIFEEALCRLGTRKRKTVVFEDSLFAIRTAKRAGFSVIALYDDASRWDKIKIQRIADAYYESFAPLCGDNP